MIDVILTSICIIQFSLVTSGAFYCLQNSNKAETRDCSSRQRQCYGNIQGAGTPNQAGIGGYLPLSVGENSVLFSDVQANVNFADYDNYSSIVATKVDGATISTSSRLGYRWLNSNRSWMYGLHAGDAIAPESSEQKTLQEWINQALESK